MVSVAFCIGFNNSTSPMATKKMKKCCAFKSECHRKYFMMMQLHIFFEVYYWILFLHWTCMQKLFCVKSAYHNVPLWTNRSKSLSFPVEKLFYQQQVLYESQYFALPTRDLVVVPNTSLIALHLYN